MVEALTTLSSLSRDASVFSAAFAAASRAASNPEIPKAAADPNGTIFHNGWHHLFYQHNPFESTTRELWIAKSGNRVLCYDSAGKKRYPRPVGRRGWGLHLSPPVPGAVALLMLAATCPAKCAVNPDEKVLVYRLRGEVRPFLFWLGRDDAGGGQITIRRTYSTPTRWREEVEVLFGSEPERIPGHINRWGHGRESGDWILDTGASAPLLLGTEFEGIMRHSTESSIDQVIPESGGAKAAHSYDVTRSAVFPKRAYHELRVFTDEEEFHYRRPERLLAKYRECLASKPPLRRRDLLNSPLAYREPYGFLTALSRSLGQITEALERSPEALGRTRPSLIFVFNAKPYLLDVTGIRRVASFQTKYGALRLRDVATVEFRCFNTVKRTRTDFALWVPLSGDLKGMPVRILLQPRWWLRLQLDLDLGVSRVLPEQERREAQIGSETP